MTDRYVLTELARPANHLPAYRAENELSEQLSRRRMLAFVASVGIAGMARNAWAEPTTAILPAGGSVPKLADLRGSRAQLGIPIYVEGFATAGDGGGGWFAWHEASQAADDGGCVLARDPQAAGRWHRLHSGAVDVRWFGARGDGVHDDHPAIQRAIDHHPEVMLPAGVYRLTRPLDMSHVWGRRLSGAGQTADPESPGGFERGRLSRASTLLLDADDSPVLKLAGSGNVIERMALMAKNRQPAHHRKSYGIELNSVSRSRLTDLRIFNCTTGIGIPQAPNRWDSRANWMFGSTLQNIDINDFSFCGLDLRNFEGGGTGMVLSQIYMANLAGRGRQDGVGDTEHFILGRNWAEYVLQAVHCEWSRCRGSAIQLHNCNANVNGLHVEGVRFGASAPSIVHVEGGHAGLNLDTTQLYDCVIEGGAAVAPLPVVASAAKAARVRLSGLRLASNVRSAPGRRLTAGAIVGGSDGQIEASNLLVESPAYVAPRPQRGMTVKG